MGAATDPKGQAPTAPPEPAAASWLTAREAALELGVHERTIRRAIDRGELPAVKLAGIFEISRAHLAAYGARRQERDSPGPRSRSSRAFRYPDTSPVPAPTTALIGREDEVTATRALLEDPGVRLVTLTGPGGVGKTRLALAVAGEIDARVVDGVVFVPLEAIREPELVSSAIARSLGVPEGGDRPLLDALQEAVRRRRQLLVLDNFEQVLPAAGVVATLLAAGPELRVLVTSREVLHLRGEHELVMHPLALPAPEPAASAVTIGSSPAVELFVRRARAALSSFMLTEDNAELVAAVCRRLDGLPLAIELAAAQIKHLSLAELLARLDRRLETLARGPRDLPDRLQAMRGAIAWSYDLLSAEERLFFRRLAVFAGGFDTAAAAAVHMAPQPPETAADSDSAWEEAWTLLASLVDKSVLYQERGADGARRYRLLETIREFAWEQLLASGEADRIRAAHAAHFLTVAEEMAQLYHGPAEIAAFTQLDAERDNIRAAFTWTLGDGGDVELGLRLGGALWWYWYVRGYLQEGWQWLRALIAREEAENSPEALADGVLAAGALAQRMILADESEALLTDALARYRRLGDERGAAFAQCALAYIAINGYGDPAKAIPMLEEELVTIKATGDRWLEAMACNGLTLAYMVLGEMRSAQAWGERTLALSRTDGNVQGDAATLALLGQIVRRRGDAAGALGHFREALEQFERIGDRGNVCACVEALAGLVASLGRPRAAAGLFGATSALRQRIGAPVAAHERPGYEADLAAVRAALDDDDFAAAWADGEATSLEEMLAGIPWNSLAGPGRKRSITASRADARAALTPREREVLALAAKGHTDKEIALLLTISPATVTKHVGNALRKLGTPSRTAAAVLMASPLTPSDAAAS